MIAHLDYYLDRITMYRLVLYYLIAILLMALGLSFFKLIPYSPISILESTAILLLVCGVTNYIFGAAFNAPRNLESAYITALILVCIVPPLYTKADLSLIIWAGILSMASKYILAFRNKHIFNPAAIAVVLTAFWLHQSASWWVGTSLMAPVILLGGLLIVHKLRKYDFIMSFFVVFLVTISIFTVTTGGNLTQNIKEVFLHSPLLFFAFAMLTEPITTPPTVFLQVLYGGLVGFLFAPQIHLGSLYSTPELALVVGNIFSYTVSPKIKERLRLTNRVSLSSDVGEFTFKPSRLLHFQPGQYLEFTLPHKSADSRGTRRYFTIASSPTEESLLLGIKFYENSSSFKKKLLALDTNTDLMAGQLAGDFVLPKNPNQKMVFIAGGIGITPFRSMLKYLIDTNQARQITLLFMNKTVDEIVYQTIFDEAATRLGIKTVHTLTGDVPESWNGRTGRVNEHMIQEEVPDFKERIFYLSGPHAMVASTEITLQKLGIASSNIKKDFFPGLA